MLRALFEREIHPDLVLGTSVGALNGAMVARDPTLGVIDRMTELWRAVAEGRRRVRRPPAAHGPPGGVDRHPHLLAASRSSERLARGVRRPHVRGAAGAVPGVRGQHRAGRRALVRLAARWSTPWSRAPPYPGCCRRRRSATSTSSTAASSTRSRSAGPSSSARPGSSCSRSAGSTGRSSRRDGRGRWPGCPSRSPAGTGSPARWASCPTTSRRTCCPRAARPTRDDSLLGAPRLLRDRSDRIDATYEARVDYLDAL